MKHIAALAVAFTICGSTTGYAGDLSVPHLDEKIIIQDTTAGSSSSGMTIVALTGLFMLAVLASK